MILNLSFNQTLLTFLLYLRETWITQLILAMCMVSQFMWRKYFLLLSLENSVDSYLCSQLVLLHSVLYFFFLYQSPSTFLCMVFYSISSNIDEVLSIDTSVNTFVFGDFKVHHEDWLTYSGGTDRPGKLWYNFPISNDLAWMVNFPTQMPDWFSQSCSLISYFWS